MKIALWIVAAFVVSGCDLGRLDAPAGELVEEEQEVHDPDRTVHVRRVVIPGLEGEPAGILTLHEDVTAQRLALEAKDLMLRAIGHEVRSPAAAMKNTLAGIMQWDNTIDASGRRELLQEAYESSDRLLSLVESQLIIAKLETRHFEPNPEPVDLGPALDGVMGVLLHKYPERSVAVQVALPAGLPAAFCEPTHVGQVLTNLIGNALEYTSGPVRVEARQVQRGWLEITVADRGQGLPVASVETLFEKTGPAGRNRSQGGLGLGLYLCRLVVERSFGGPSDENSAPNSVWPNTGIGNTPGEANRVTNSARIASRLFIQSPVGTPIRSSGDVWSRRRCRRRAGAWGHLGGPARPMLMPRPPSAG